MKIYAVIVAERIHPGEHNEFSVDYISFMFDLVDMTQDKYKLASVLMEQCYNDELVAENYSLTAASSWSITAPGVYVVEVETPHTSDMNIPQWLIGMYFSSSVKLLNDHEELENLKHEDSIKYGKYWRDITNDIKTSSRI